MRFVPHHSWPASLILAGLLALLLPACVDEGAGPLDPGPPSLAHKAGNPLPASFRIAYTSLGGTDQNIVVMKQNGTDRIQLTGAPGEDWFPVWSPDGGMIAYDCDYYLCVMNADGTGQTILGQHQVGLLPFAWSPDGSKIAYSTNGGVSGTFEDIYVANVDGSGESDLTNHPDGPESGPVWSPDGGKIAFSRWVVPAYDYEIFVMNADGTGQTNLTNTSSGWDWDPAWSPDGTKIAFRSNRDGNDEIYVMNADGTGPLNLTQDPGADYDPTWSPDGSQILFGRLIGLSYDVYLMNADGTGVVNLTNSPSTSDYSATWAAEGTKVVFQSNRDGDWEIYVLNVDGGHVVNLTNDPSSQDQYPSVR